MTAGVALINGPGKKVIKVHTVGNEGNGSNILHLTHISRTWIWD